MSIKIHLLQNLLTTQSRQERQFKVLDAKFLQESELTEPEEKTFVSTESKRQQIYQRTAEDVLKRLMENPEGKLDDGDRLSRKTFRYPGSASDKKRYDFAKTHSDFNCRKR